MTDAETGTEYELYDEDDILGDGAWQEGDCDNCAGFVPGPGDPLLTPACACKTGQGAAEDCRCGGEAP